MKYGYIDQTGNVVVPLIYDHTQGQFSDGVTCVWSADANGIQKNGFINADGTLLTPMEYDDAHYFSDGLASVAKLNTSGNRKWGAIDKSGNLVIPYNYDGIDSFNNGIAFVYNVGTDGHEKIGIIDKNGTEITPLEYDFAVEFSEGLACVGQFADDGSLKFGFIDDSGAVAIPLKFESSYYCNYTAFKFTGGLACIEKADLNGNSEFGFIDRDGTLVVSFGDYDDAGLFDDGRLGWVQSGLSYGIFENPYFAEEVEEIGAANVHDNDSEIIETDKSNEANNEVNRSQSIAPIAPVVIGAVVIITAVIFTKKYRKKTS